jgi:hypothetical protein
MLTISHEKAPGEWFEWVGVMKHNGDGNRMRLGVGDVPEGRLIHGRMTTG